MITPEATPDQTFSLAIEEYAKSIGTQFITKSRPFVDYSVFYKAYLKKRLKPIQYLVLTNTTLVAVDGNRPMGEMTAPYASISVDIADPQCFDKIEAFFNMSPPSHPKHSKDSQT
jgi:hypothetical protein